MCYHCLTNILKYLFEILCLVNEQISSGELFKFDCNTVMQNRNVEKGMQSISFYCIPCRNEPCSHLSLKKKTEKGTFLCFSFILMAHYFFFILFTTTFNNLNIANSNIFFGPLSVRINGC